VDLTCGRKSCCDSDLTIEELALVDQSVTIENSEDSFEMAALYYVCGYISFKEGVLVERESTVSYPEAEFFDLVDRGKLSRPQISFVHFAHSCFHIFENVESNLCCNRLCRLFACLGTSFPVDFEGHLPKVCRRLANVFLKGFVKRYQNEQQDCSAPEARKRQKLSFT